MLQIQNYFWQFRLHGTWKKQFPLEFESLGVFFFLRCIHMYLLSINILNCWASVGHPRLPQRPWNCQFPYEHMSRAHPTNNLMCVPNKLNSPTDRSNPQLRRQMRYDRFFVYETVWVACFCFSWRALSCIHANSAKEHWFSFR